MQTDVRSASSITSETLYPGRTRVRGVYYLAGATAGTMVLHDGGSGGDPLIAISTPADASVAHYIDLPGEGVLFETDVYLNIANAAGVTIFYG